MGLKTGGIHSDWQMWTLLSYGMKLSARGQKLPQRVMLRNTDSIASSHGSSKIRQKDFVRCAGKVWACFAITTGEMLTNGAEFEWKQSEET